MLTVATLFWQPNVASRDFSRCYDESWVEKLYRGFRRGGIVGEVRGADFTGGIRLALKRGEAVALRKANGRLRRRV